jgi:hypothetical protein
LPQICCSPFSVLSIAFISPLIQKSPSSGNADGQAHWRQTSRNTRRLSSGSASQNKKKVSLGRLIFRILSVSPWLVRFHAGTVWLLQETRKYPGRVSSLGIIQDVGIIPDYKNDSGIIWESNQLDVKIIPENHVPISVLHYWDIGRSKSSKSRRAGVVSRWKQPKNNSCLLFRFQNHLVERSVRTRSKFRHSCQSCSWMWSIANSE